MIVSSQAINIGADVRSILRVLLNFGPAPIPLSHSPHAVHKLVTAGVIAGFGWERSSGSSRRTFRVVNRDRALEMLEGGAD